MSILNDYTDIINDLAGRAYDYIKDGTEDESEAINQAIDDGLIYYEDQGTVVAAYICTYCPKWSEPLDFEEIYMMLYDDISTELESLKEHHEAMEA